jgi:hypothetical protein
MKRIIWIIILALLPTLLHGAAFRNPDSPFGVIAPWGGIKDAGIKWVRCGAGCTALDWGAIEKARGVYDWKDADNEVNNTIKNEGADLLPILGYTPKWASSGPNGENSYPPQDLKDWSDFVYRIVHRYKGKIKYWEVWNEEDIGFFKGTIEQYTDLLKSAYVAAKKGDPDCKIVFGGMAGVNIPFAERVYQNGGGYYYDVMAVHPYQWGDTFDDAWFVKQLIDLHEFMAKNGDPGKEIWLTELGWSTGDKAITNDIQARLLAQAMITSLTLRKQRVAKTFWFCVKDWGGPGYGLIADDGSRKPAFDAYKWVAETFEGSHFSHEVESKGLRSYLFLKRDKVMIAAWSPDKEVRQLLLPDGYRWKTVQRMMGPVQTLNESRVSIGPEPIVISTDKTVNDWRDFGITQRCMLKLDVWYSVQVPQGTTRPYLARGKPSPIKIVVHNDSPRAEEVGMVGWMGKLKTSVAHLKIGAGKTAEVELSITVPPAYKPGLATLDIEGWIGLKGLAFTHLPVRIADGPSTEFTANSTVESAYLVEDKGSGGAPSVRFNGAWTYKFDLARANGGTLDLCVGAHQAQEWRVLLSSDQKTWITALSGKSTRSWHSVDLTPYAHGPLYVKFEGNDQQLSELILSRRTGE